MENLKNIEIDALIKGLNSILSKSEISLSKEDRELLIECVKVLEDYKISKSKSKQSDLLTILKIVEIFLRFFAVYYDKFSN